MNSMSQTEVWHLAQTWVKSNRVLIWYIAAPYYKYMPCNSKDLDGEALLTAYNVLSILIRKRKKLSSMSRYYQTVFRTQCIRLTSCVETLSYDIDQVPVTVSGSDQQEVLDEEVIQGALQVLTNRQRQISQWILSQPAPVNTATVGKQFGIRSRTVRSIVNNAIKRIENYEYQPVREKFAATS